MNVTGKPLVFLCLIVLLFAAAFPLSAASDSGGAEIGLCGGEKLEWLCGVPFKEPGFTARGPEGEDRSGDVKVEGRVRVWRAGDYTLRYVLREGDTVLAERERTVHVVPQSLPETVQPPKGTICLTFDDGPCEYTEQALETLAKYNVKATFFVIANRTKFLDLLPKIVEQGHTLGIHCYDHTGYGWLYKNEENYFGDLLKAQEIVREYTGEYAHVLRFPGGGRTASFLAGTLEGGYGELYDILHDMGIRVYDWNVQPESSSKTTEGTIVDFTHPREPYEYAVVLQHDARRFSVAALDKMIQWALDEGYTFASLDETFPEIHLE